MKTLPLLIAAAALPFALSGCMTATRIALAVAPTGSVAVNERVAEHCVGALQSGQPVDQRRQVRADFAGIAYDMEILPRTTAAQQAGTLAARRMRRDLCPPLSTPGGLVTAPLNAEVPPESTPQ